ncbi:MAG: ubiquinol-cytochrome c reductase iron-sulfur subunit [Haloarculaceae archaeon]
MPRDEDKYPEESGRRRFVKGIVGSAALSSVGAGGAAALDATTQPSGQGGGTTTYFGIENIGGPAPRGMPMIPIEITSSGEIQGVPPSTAAEASASGFNGSGVPYIWEWFQYCGVQSYAGIGPADNADNLFRASQGTYHWQNDYEDGAPLTVDMFSDYQDWGNGIGRSGLGKPGMATWRSQAEGAQTIPVQVLRTPAVGKMVDAQGEYSDIDESVRAFVEGATAQNVMAWLDKCTHFCCTPGFKADPVSAKFDAENDVYCPCHQSVYNPFSVVQRNFVAYPRPFE